MHIFQVIIKLCIGFYIIRNFSTVFTHWNFIKSCSITVISKEREIQIYIYIYEIHSFFTRIFQKDSRMININFPSMKYNIVSKNILIKLFYCLTDIFIYRVRSKNFGVSKVIRRWVKMSYLISEKSATIVVCKE